MKIIANAFGIIIAVLMLASCSQSELKTSKIIRGDFKKSIIETGELEALNAKYFVMPRFSRYFWFDTKITFLVEHGDKVNPADTIIQFDPAEIQKLIIDREAVLANQKAALQKMMVQQQITRQNNKATLLTEQASFDLKTLELDLYKFESETARKIKEMEYQQSQIRIKKTKRRIELNEIVEKNDLIIQKLRVKQVEDMIQSLYDIIPQMTITTETPGIFQRARQRRSTQRVDVGDEVHPGSNIANVPDLTWMMVETTVNETDISKIQNGQKVVIRMDALPGVPFEGEVTFISKLCRAFDNDSRQKVFDVHIKCMVSDERLKPGMTVSCEFICADKKNVIYIPNNCVQTNEGNHFIYLKKGNKIVKTQVEIGERNNHYTMLLGDYKEGQKIIPIKEIVKTENR